MCLLLENQQSITEAKNIKNNRYDCTVSLFLLFSIRSMANKKEFRYIF